MKINLIEAFEETVSLFPNKLAVVDNEYRGTFAQLRSSAITLSIEINKTTTQLNKPIAIFLPKSKDAIISFIAALYSGNCYAPLDIKNPEQRIESILEVLKPALIITNTVLFDTIGKISPNVKILNIDTISDSDKVDTNKSYLNCIDTDPAYIIHTSGSTGVPKGVAISHRSIFDYIHWAIYAFDISKNENIGNQASFIFDNSTLDIYLMMFTGASLNLIPNHLFAFPLKLVEYLKINNINFIFWVPSVLVTIANQKILEKVNLLTLKKVLFAGEVMPTKQLKYWINNLDENVIFANLYGPTEITVDCTYYIVDRSFEDSELLPIGFPCRNTDILILNAKNELCKKGEHGELCVRGSSLALGYWNNFEKTDLMFVQNPLNKSFHEKIYKTGDIVFFNELNEIIFVGRKDFQIKHLGYRIELGEIEHAVLRVFHSIAACALYDQIKNEIVLVYESEQEISLADFRIKLNSVLAKYMIPNRYVKLDKLPKSPSGKIDRSFIKNSLIK